MSATARCRRGAAALFTRMSIVPASAAISANVRLTASSSVTSHTCDHARRPRAVTIAATSSRGAAVRPITATSAPASASASASTRPRSRPPPVTTATRPSRSVCISVTLSHGSRVVFSLRLAGASRSPVSRTERDDRDSDGRRRAPARLRSRRRARRSAGVLPARDRRLAPVQAPRRRGRPRPSACGSITADRPGVGGSSPKQHRSILDWVADAEAIADAVGLESFVVAGHSGGGPHALAIAKQLGDRVTKVGLAAPIAPFDQDGTKGMVKDKDLKLIFHLAHVKWLATRRRQGRVQALREAPPQLRRTLREGVAGRRGDLHRSRARADVRGGVR